MIVFDAFIFSPTLNVTDSVEVRSRSVRFLSPDFEVLERVWSGPEIYVS